MGGLPILCSSKRPFLALFDHPGGAVLAQCKQIAPDTHGPGSGSSSVVGPQHRMIGAEPLRQQHMLAFGDVDDGTETCPPGMKMGDPISPPGGFNRTSMPSITERSA